MSVLQPLSPRDPAKDRCAAPLERFVTNRAALVGLAILAPMLLAILTYPLWWPYAPNEIDLLRDEQGALAPGTGSAPTASAATSSRG